MVFTSCSSRSSIAFVVAAIVFISLFVDVSSDSSSHFESYTYYESVAQYNCYTTYYTWCYNWWYYNYWYWGWYWRSDYYWCYYWNPWWGWGRWNWCYSRPSYNCYYTYTSVARTGQRCASGRWTGYPNCNVPICNPGCTGGQICTDVNTCSCPSTASGGSNCDSVPCSRQNNCFPGTCVSGNCQCYHGFTGDNCDTIAQTPNITDCSVKLSANSGSSEVVVGTAPCVAQGLTPLPVWIGTSNLDMSKASTDYGLTNIEPKWTVDYPIPIAMSSKAAFISSNATGITMSKFSVSVPSLGFTSSTLISCLRETSNDNPVTHSVDCDVPTAWSNVGLGYGRLVDNMTFIVTISAQYGGYKSGNPSYSNAGVSYGFGTQYFTGQWVTASVAFALDLTPPTHCLLRQSDISNCTVFPIFLDQDIRTDPVINPKFLGWTDSGSGIDKFHVEVFVLTLNPTTSLLESIGTALTPPGPVNVTPSLNNYQFTAPQVGVYSIVLTVYDRAGNSARARKIFTYNNQRSLKTNSQVPVHFQEADSKTNYAFITTLYNKNRLVLDWTGRYNISDVQTAVLQKRVTDWGAADPKIDDKYGNKYGMRSIAAITGATGISSIYCTYTVDGNGGLGATQPNATIDDNTTRLELANSAQTAILEFSQPLQDGDTVVAWLSIIDSSTGDQDTVVVKSTVAGSAPQSPPVNADKFQKNAINHFTSSVSITAFDKVSGINRTCYQIYETRTQVAVHSDCVQATLRDNGNVYRKKRAAPKPCTAADNATCYCTPFRQCYDYQQVIAIDNCWIDLYKDTSKFSLVFTYQVYNGAGLTTATPGIIPLSDLNGVECRASSSDGISGGGIAGIVIAILVFLIILLLLIILIILVIRLRRNQPIPKRLEPLARTVHQRMERFTVRGRTMGENNTAYAASSPPLPKYSEEPKFEKNVGLHSRENKAYNSHDSLYLTNDKMVTSGISRKQLQFDQSAPIAEGKFAVIRRAYLDQKNERQVVAAKALRNGFSQADERLMLRKITFLKELPGHQNIVKFIASIDEGSQEGPIMLLELCEISLKDWLANLTSVTPDNLEEMLNFTLNIARGVEFLHSQQVVHRRLAVRNVLLKQQANGLVAKLIGFGPSAEDVSGSGDNAGAGAAVPVKWMAPETLDTLGKKATYNEKTDAWSYGIAIWEMYSKGATPYGELRSAEVKNQVKRGYRLQCPELCPPYMFDIVVKPCWNEQAKQRPAFKDICRQIEEFRNSSEQPGYYGDTEQPLYNNAS